MGFPTKREKRRSTSVAVDIKSLKTHFVDVIERNQKDIKTNKDSKENTKQMKKNTKTEDYLKLKESPEEDRIRNDMWKTV